MRVTTAAMEALDGHVYAVQWLAIARLIVTLAEQDAIVVADGSAFAQAWDAMLGFGFGEVRSARDEDCAEGLAADLRAVLASQSCFA